MNGNELLKSHIDDRAKVRLLAFINEHIGVIQYIHRVLGDDVSSKVQLTLFGGARVAIESVIEALGYRVVYCSDGQAVDIVEKEDEPETHEEEINGILEVMDEDSRRKLASYISREVRGAIYESPGLENYEVLDMDFWNERLKPSEGGR